MSRRHMQLFAVVAAVVLVVSGAGQLSAQVIDSDRDLVPDGVDNCPLIPNPEQTDDDMDKVGDVFDPETGAPTCDMCPGSTPDIPSSPGGALLVVNSFGCSLSQACPCLGPMGTQATWKSRLPYLKCVARTSKALRRDLLIDKGQRHLVRRIARRSACGRTKGRPGDKDGDGILDAADNCPNDRNTRQRDFDGNGVGDACDPDRDGDGERNGHDNCPREPNAGQEDGDNDGVGTACDGCQETPEEDRDDVDDRGCS